VDGRLRAVLVGDPQRFAIEAEPGEPVDGWILGRFRLWLGGVAVGDWDDAADLRGCANWLEDFATRPVNRFEARLEHLSADDLVRILYDDFMTKDVSRGGDSDAIADIYSRFHISHLGMSSFNAIDLLLVAISDGSERCVWRNACDGAIGEARLAHGEMETVAADFSRQFRAMFPGAIQR
jgi:hypothetical protein